MFKKLLEIEDRISKIDETLELAWSEILEFARSHPDFQGVKNDNRLWRAVKLYLAGRRDLNFFKYLLKDLYAHLNFGFSFDIVFPKFQVLFKSELKGYEFSRMIMTDTKETKIKEVANIESILTRKIIVEPKRQGKERYDNLKGNLLNLNDLYIDRTTLSTRSDNILRQVGIIKIGQLLKFIENDPQGDKIRKIRHCGTDSHAEIMSLVAAVNEGLEKFKESSFIRLHTYSINDFHPTIRKILMLIKENGFITRDELANKAGISKGRIYLLTKELIDSGFLKINKLPGDSKKFSWEITSILSQK